MNNIAEKSALRISVIGASLFAVVGLSFAVITKSQAILLDGAFNFISAIMAIFATRIATLVGRPDTIERPLGYIALEPFYVLIKGAILSVLTIVVVVSNVILLFQGGSELQLGIVVIYITAVVFGNAIVYLLIRTKEKKTKSPLIAIERENWLINTLISSAIAVSFLIVFFLKDSALSFVVPYVDQVVVILVGLISLPVPIRAVKQGFGELLLLGPDKELLKNVQKEAEGIIANHAITRHKVFVLKIGRKLIVTLYVEPAEKHVSASLSDKLREELTHLIAQGKETAIVDVVITKNF